VSVDEELFVAVVTPRSAGAATAGAARRRIAPAVASPSVQRLAALPISLPECEHPENLCRRKEPIFSERAGARQVTEGKPC
jgi:hypothetical protein